MTRHESKTRLLQASVDVFRARGYTATRIEDICQAAGLTKGSFFHHFKSKQDLALAAADYWSATTGELFASAPYHAHPDPLQRVLAYVDFRKTLITGEVPAFSCLVGTIVQEVFDTVPAVREACERSISEHAATLEDDIAAARKQYKVKSDWTARSLALHTQAVLQGAFILAKAKGGPEVAADSVDHLRRYIELLFEKPKANRGGS
ncbi:MAG TPA: TetR/AcrR family transcriptional regulator [Gammaproteobacteria bacterium]|nr:TetR/AcrR family transcriptional regulator [Gammaproteobacteria bacterium]